MAHAGNARRLVTLYDDGSGPISGNLSPAFALRSRHNLPAKQRIARWAADMVNDGDSVFLDTSTTVFHMVAFLRDVRNLTVVW